MVVPIPCLQVKAGSEKRSPLFWGDDISAFEIGGLGHIMVPRLSETERDDLYNPFSLAAYPYCHVWIPH